MRADRFGSYSIAATLAGTSFLFLRKSITRYFLLCAPPRCQDVILPWLFLPARFSLFSTRLRSGFFWVRSSFVRTVMERTPGEVGLNFLIPMSYGSLPACASHAFEKLDLVARFEHHDRLLPAGTPSDDPPPGLRLDVEHLDLEQLLDRLLDLLLVRPGVHGKRHRVGGLLEQCRFFRDQRPLQYVRDVHFPSTSLMISNAGRVNTSCSYERMSTTLRAETGSDLKDGRLRIPRSSVFLGSSVTRRAWERPSFPATFRNSLVRVPGRSRSSTSTILFSLARALRAHRSAAFMAFRLTFCSYLRGCGPNTVPPPRSKGVRMLPIRARPVPFWRYGFFPPPRTSFRVLVEAFPERFAFRWATTTRWSRCSFTSAPKTDSGHSTVSF